MPFADDSEATTVIPVPNCTGGGGAIVSHTDAVDGRRRRSHHWRGQPNSVRFVPSGSGNSNQQPALVYGTDKKKGQQQQQQKQKQLVLLPDDHKNKMEGMLLGTVAEYLGSNCGVHFDKYVRKTLYEVDDDDRLVFPYSNTGPASRKIKGALWPGRRLKILPISSSSSKKGGGGTSNNHHSMWHEAKVTEWEQFCAGPYSPATLWFLTIELVVGRERGGEEEEEEEEGHEEFLSSGDLVEITGLKSAAQYNGKLGVIVDRCSATPDSSAGRFEVEILGGDGTAKAKKNLLIKPPNLIRVHRLRMEVGRVNINGGGTLIGEKEEDDGIIIISFEWIDTAVPSIDLSPLSLLDEEFQQPPESEEEEEYYYSTPSDLEARRSDNLAAFAERTPSIKGLPDCNPEDGSFISTPRRLAFNGYMEVFSAQLLQTSQQTDLAAFRKTLMEQPLQLWNNENMSHLLDEWSIDALKVIVHVLKQRYLSGCFRSMAIWNEEKFGCIEERYGGSVSVAMADDHFAKYINSVANTAYTKWTCNFCSAIGFQYEEMGEYHRAIPWYHKALDLAKVGYRDFPNAVIRKYQDLAAAYIGAGFLVDALKWYDQSPEENEVSAGRVLLLNELKKWTGTSGYMVGDNPLERIRDGKISELVRMVPCSGGGAHPYYGGIPIGGSNRIPTSSFYASLNRSPPPPLRKSQLSKFISNEAKQTYTSIYNGSFDLEILHSDEKLLKVAVIGTDIGRRFWGPLMLIEYLGHGVDVKASAAFSACTTEEQRMDLAFRVIHLFIRSYAYTVNKSLAFHACDALRGECCEKKYWKDALDCAFIQVDMCFNLLNADKSKMAKAYYNLGEALESCGRFSEAANVYKEASECYASCPINASSLHGNSGLAYKRVEDYENAEKEYVASLHFYVNRSGVWNLNDAHSDGCYGNIFYLYDSWFQGSSGRGGGGIATMTETDMIGPLLIGLLFCAGFKTRSDFSKEWVTKNGPMFRRFLDSRFYQPAAAKEALVAATSTASVADFRSKMLQCRRRNLITLASKDGQQQEEEVDSSSPEEIRRRNMKQNMQNARNSMLGTNEISSSSVGSLISRCENVECHKMGTNYKQCPCKTVSYCSKECQRAHWNAGHKKLCPLKK